MESIEKAIALWVENGSVSGYGYGDGVTNFCGRHVYEVDDIQTIITSIHGNYAKGQILNRDLTTAPCWIAKQDRYFAHGKTLREAHRALIEKLYEAEPLEDRINRFVSEHKQGVEYPAEDFYSWHHILTGSCKMGRKTFAKDHGIDIENDTMTVERFIELTKNSYGGYAILELEKHYKGKEKKTCHTK